MSLTKFFPALNENFTTHGTFIKDQIKCSADENVMMTFNSDSLLFQEFCVLKQVRCLFQSYQKFDTFEIKNNGPNCHLKVLNIIQKAKETDGRCIIELWITQMSKNVSKP